MIDPEKLAARRARDAERKRKWRKENRDEYNKCKREYRARKAVKRVRNRDSDEVRARKVKRARDKYRLEHGIPLDAPIKMGANPYATEEERHAARLAANRRAWAKKNGTTVEEIDARNAARKAAREAREKCPKVAKIPAKISERKTTKRTIHANPSTSRAPTRSATTPALVPRISNLRKPGLLTLRSCGKWWF